VVYSPQGGTPVHARGHAREQNQGARVSSQLLGYLLLVVAGAGAGWINTIAGGGSLLTVPALMWFGLPADIANGTSRIAILAQGVTAVYGFWRARQLDMRLLGQVAIPCALGALLGAYAATLIPNAVLTPLIVATLVVMAGTMFLNPAAFAPPAGSEPLSPVRRPAALLALFAAGFYGGFLQAGVGIVLLMVFATLLHIDLVRGNGLKVAVVFLSTMMAVPIFAARARVDWGSGAVLASGQVIGASLGVHFALTRGQAAIQRALFVVIVIMALALLFKH
jgi:uncharacterized membrane protein YfcA